MRILKLMALGGLSYLLAGGITLLLLGNMMVAVSVGLLATVAAVAIFSRDN